MSERQKVKDVLDRWSPETIKEIARTIRETRSHHPADATCECEAMDALKVVLAAERGTGG